MQYTTTPFMGEHINAAVALDARWFGDKGVSAVDLQGLLLQHSNLAIALLRRGILCGFATFEIIDADLPNGYVGTFPHRCPTLFIHQFTTDTNYHCTDTSADLALLQAVEQLALQRDILEIAEALDKNHPYSKTQNAEFDVFGFYAKHGYTVDAETHLTWQPSEVVKVDCVVLRKKLAAPML